MSNIHKIHHVISKKYKVIDIKEGGMGIIYICHDLKTNSLAALKTYKPEKDNKILRSQFIEEASSWIDIGKGDYILSPDEILFEFGTPFIKMPYYKNGSVRDLINGGEISEEFSVKSLVEICIGMWRLGEVEGFIHQDIKPENILFNNENEAVIADLGMAKVYKESLTNQIKATGGTVPYMSPEQILGKEIDIRADIYAIGLIFYEMLTGEVAFFAENIEGILSNKIKNKPRLINSIKPKYKDFILKLSSPDISKRPKSYQEVFMMLDSFISPGIAAKKLSILKRDQRIVISSQKIIAYWLRLFHERAADKYSSSTFKAASITKLHQSQDYRNIGEHTLAIKLCENILIEKTDKGTPFKNILNGLELHDIVSQNDEISFILNHCGRDMYITALEILLLSSVDYIESKSTEDTINETIKYFVLKSANSNNIPVKIKILCAQIFVLYKDFSKAENLLHELINEPSVDIRFRALATLAHLYHFQKNVKKLEQLIQNNILPVMKTYDTHVAQRTCGQVLGMIGDYSNAAHYLYNAFSLNNNDLWALKHAIICSINAQKIKQAINLFNLLEKISPDSNDYMETKSILKKMQII